MQIYFTKKSILNYVLISLYLLITLFVTWEPILWSKSYQTSWTKCYDSKKFCNCFKIFQIEYHYHLFHLFKKVGDIVAKKFVNKTASKLWFSLRSSSFLCSLPKKFFAMCNSFFGSCLEGMYSDDKHLWQSNLFETD